MSGFKGKAGRPKGRKKSAKIEVMIEPQKREEFKHIAESTGTNISVKTRELIIEYIQKMAKMGGV